MGKSSSSSDAAGQAAQSQQRLAERLVREVGPLRRELINDAGEFVSGDRDVTGLPEFGAFKDAAEGQFNVARDNIIANTPEGGGLVAALANLEGDRASNQTAFTGDLSRIETDRALAIASGGTIQGTQAGGQAGFLQSQLAQNESMENAGKSQGAGTAAGAAAAAAIKRMGSTATVASDIRLKKNIRHIGFYGSHNLYAFDYLDGTHSVGVMAQEMPDKYVTEVDGYLMVDYGMLING